MGHIYMLKSPSGKIYIGQTIRPIHKRFKEHRTGKSSGCVAIYNAIQKYGWENFEKDWYECPDEDLDDDEGLLVREMETLSPNGYNLKEGGGNGKHSEETKQKMSDSRKGEKNVNYGKIGEKNHLYKIPLSEETKQKLRKPRSEETKQKMRKPKSEEHKQHMSGANNYKSKTVYQYDLSGIFIRSFGSTEEASRHLGKNNGATIRRCALGKLKKAHGYKWSYIMT